MNTKMNTKPLRNTLLGLLTFLLFLGTTGLANAQTAAADSAAVGNVVFVTGDAKLDRAGEMVPLSKGQSVRPGDRIQTGPDGHVHLRMIDHGFIAVRASSALKIQDYAYYPDSPADNKVRINLEAGVARTVSGKAGEATRERYRFNTPIAAIGLRGTDYVVQATSDITRVTVLRGEVAVSPLGGGCSAEAISPCSGPLVRELNARTPHAYLEVHVRGGAPVLVLPENGKDAPNRTSPARPEEPQALSDNPLTTAHASNVLGRVTEPRPEFTWGRWQHLSQLSTPTLVSLAADDREITFANELFGLLRPSGNFAMPATGQVALNYAGGEAYVRGAGNTYTQATLNNGRLNLDFNGRQFDTSLTAITQQTVTSLQAQGQINFQGMLYGDPSRSNMNVSGAISSGAKEAGYLFDATLVDGQTLIGATRWKR